MSNPKLMSMLPRLDDIFEKRGKECYELIHNEGKGTFMIARRDIKPSEVILIEKPLHSQPIGYSPSLLLNPSAAPFLATIKRFDRSHSHPSDPSEIPSELRRAVERLAELNATELLSKSQQIGEIWKLHDAHRCAEVGDTVMVDGLVSENGKMLNGKIGRAVGLDKSNTDRLAVDVLIMSKQTGGLTKQREFIKQGNLKTLGGIFRSNSFQSVDQTELLFKVLCRINHACGDAANAMRLITDDKVYLLSKRDIRAGEEIFIDYIPGEAGDRVRILHLNYNFVCKCPGH